MGAKRVKMSGLTAPIADAPPAGTYAVPAGPLGLSKAKVAAAVLVAGVVGTAVALSAATGSNNSNASLAVQTASTPVITFPKFVAPDIDDPCGCDDMQIVAQCDDLTVLVDPANKLPRTRAMVTARALSAQSRSATRSTTLRPT